MPRNDSDKGGRSSIPPGVRTAEVPLPPGTKEMGASPKAAPPKAEVSRKPPGANLPKSKPSSEKP